MIKEYKRQSDIVENTPDYNPVSGLYYQEKGEANYVIFLEDGIVTGIVDYNSPRRVEALWVGNGFPHPFQRGSIDVESVEPGKPWTPDEIREFMEEENGNHN